jgi:membrane-associated protease RseP (regulator of RpoE activity)
VPISEFCIGFPGTPVIWQFGRYRETVFTIRLLPFGGFVRFGADWDDEAIFESLSPNKKAIILVAGSAVNLVAGFLLMVVALVAVRGLGYIDAAAAVFGMMRMIVCEVFLSLVHLDVSGVSGPVGAAVVAREVMTKGFWPMVGFIGLMSFSVGIMNLLPVPGFDGWHVLLAGIEAVRGKPFSRRFQVVAGAAGFLVIVALMVAVAYHDVTRIANVPDVTNVTK